MGIPGILLLYMLPDSSNIFPGVVSAIFRDYGETALFLSQYT